MTPEDLLRHAHQTAQELPGAEVGQPFGPDWDVYKVSGKVFALLSQVAGEQILTVKADPVDAVALCQDYAEIRPGYHMNKRHWVTLTPGPSLDPDLVRELVSVSYLLVVERLPRSRRPVDPDSFAEAAGLTG